MHKAVDYRLALRSVGYFRMKLYRVKTACFVGHTGNLRDCIGSDHHEARWQQGDFVAMAHPHIQQAVACLVVTILNVAK